MTDSHTLRTVPGHLLHSPARSRAYLAVNESPFGPLPTVLDAIEEAAKTVNRYPATDADEVASALSTFHDVAKDDVFVGNGSVGALETLLRARSAQGTDVIYPWPAFEAYPMLIRRAGARPVPVGLTDDHHHLEAMAHRVTARTRAIIICNPHNPTGSTISREALERFIARVPADCLVVIDEAYREYVLWDGFPDGLDVYRRFPNVAVLRTFSKAYGLAGLRVGYLVARHHVIESMRRWAVPFLVNHLAQRAAVASLGANEELRSRIAMTIAERERLRVRLSQIGVRTPESHANFVWIPTAHARGFADACAHAGVYVRRVGDAGVRVTVGEAVHNDLFLKAASTLERPLP